MIYSLELKSQEEDGAVSGPAYSSTNEISFAKGGSHSDLAGGTGDATAAAGGIALSSLIKNGQLSAGGDDP